MREYLLRSKLIIGDQRKSGNKQTNPQPEQVSENKASLDSNQTSIADLQRNLEGQKASPKQYNPNMKTMQLIQRVQQQNAMVSERKIHR